MKQTMNNNENHKKGKEATKEKTLQNDTKIEPKKGLERDLNINTFLTFLSLLKPILGQTWRQQQSLFSQDPLQEAFGMPPGAFLKGAKKGPQHRRLLRSIFHKFLKGSGGPGGSKK